jgi:hypothetical protein
MFKISFVRLNSAMPCSTSSGASSPWGFSSGSDCDEFGTPLTERSLLFDSHDIEVAVQQSVLDQHILVVGGCGFIGSHTVWELAKAGYNVIAAFPSTTTKLILGKIGNYNRQSQQCFQFGFRQTGDYGDPIL